MLSKTVLAGLVMMMGCATEKTEIGDATVGAYTFHIFREGPAAGAGVETTLVLKSTVGGNPTAIAGWVGIETDSESRVTAAYDSNDGDYDLDVTCASPFLADSQFWFTVDTNGELETASIDLQ